MPDSDSSPSSSYKSAHESAGSSSPQDHADDMIPKIWASEDVRYYFSKKRNSRNQKEENYAQIGLIIAQQYSTKVREAKHIVNGKVKFEGVAKITPILTEFYGAGIMERLNLPEIAKVRLRSIAPYRDGEAAQEKLRVEEAAYRGTAIVLYERLDMDTLGLVKQFLNSNKKDSIPWKIIARELVTGLTKIHKKDVVHRDIKPQNYMINQNGHPHDPMKWTFKFIDFQTALEASEFKDKEYPMVAREGTLGYMSPGKKQTPMYVLE